MLRGCRLPLRLALREELPELARFASIVDSVVLGILIVDDELGFVVAYVD